MPVVINELVLRGTVEAPPVNGRAPKKTEREQRVDREALVETSVEKVMDILDRKNER